jgi:hypothetical protein
MPTKSAPAPDPLDAIRQLVIARAAELGLTPYAIAARTEGVVSRDSLERYWYRSSDTTGRLTDRKLAAVLAVLGLRVLSE